MDINFVNDKLENLVSDRRAFTRKYGQQNFKKLEERIEFLKRTENLFDVPTSPPVRCHELKGDRKGTFSIILHGALRLVFEPDHVPVPLKEDGGIDLTEITVITILEITDYH